MSAPPSITTARTEHDSTRSYSTRSDDTQLPPNQTTSGAFASRPGLTSIGEPSESEQRDTDLPQPKSVPEEEPRFTLSATQVAASMAAAVTAAVVGSRLGVAGTVIGAGLASVISVIGGAIFGHTILLTRRQVKRVLQVRTAAGDSVAFVAPDNNTAVSPAVARYTTRTAGSTQLPRTDADATVVIPAVVIPTVAQADLVPAAWSSRPGPERAEPRRPLPTRRRLGTGLLLGIAATAAIFASSLGAVTMIEAVKGSPLAGGDAGGLTVLGGNGGSSGGSVDSDAPITLPEAPESESPEPGSTEAESGDPATVTTTVTSEVTATETTTAPASSGSEAESSSPGAPTTSPASADSSGLATPSPSAGAATVANPLRPTTR